MSLLFNNKLFTEFQGHIGKEYLPPYELPPTLDEEQKSFIHKNDDRISEHWSWKAASVPKLPPVPPPSKEPPEAKNIQAKPPQIQYVKNVEDVIMWTTPRFP